MKIRPLSPEKADEIWQHLYPACSTDHISTKSINAFRHILNPPPTLNSFAVIVDNLVPVFSVLNQIRSITAQAMPTFLGYIDEWVTFCNEVADGKNSIAQRINGYSDDWVEGADPPFRGHYESHCLGVALWCRVTGIHQNRFRLAQAMLILAVDMGRTIAQKKEFPIHDQLDGACRSIRKLSKGFYAAILASLPDTPVSIQEYRRKVLGLVKNSKHILYPFLHLLEIAIGIKSVKSRDSFEKNSNTPSNIIVDYDYDSDSREKRGRRPKIQQIKSASLDKSIARRARKNLSHPEEFTRGIEAISCSSEGENPAGGRSRSQQYLEARAAAARIAIDNQKLATDLDRLIPYDVKMFLARLQDVSLENGSIGKVKRVELAAFLAICFWTSRSIKEVRACSFVPSPALSYEKIAVFRETDGSLHWVIFARKPDLTKKVEIETEKQALSTVERFTIPFTSEAAQTVNPWLSVVLVEKYSITPLFNRSMQDYEDAIDKYFIELKEYTPGRQNFFRINSHIHDRISRLSKSDVTAAIAISGRMETLGIVPHYYTAHSVEKLQDLYLEAVKDIGTPAKAHKLPTQVRGTSTAYVGSRFVPRSEVVISFVTTLQKRIKFLRSTPSSYETLIRLHNVLTAYTVLLVGFATGYRAVSDPLFHDTEIDRISGFAVISDKDGDDFYNSRIVWLPPVCLDQLDEYAKHLTSFRNWLFNYSQDLFFQSRQESIIGRRADRRTPALFYLGSKMKDFTVRPKHLEELMRIAEYYLPVNANRHYLRTNLLSMGCPLEVINAFMGHWERGQEPWSKFSGLSPEVYRDHLQQHLIRLLKDDKWDAQTGMGTRHLHVR